MTPFTILVLRSRGQMITELSTLPTPRPCPGPAVEGGGRHRGHPARSLPAPPCSGPCHPPASLPPCPVHPEPTPITACPAARVLRNGAWPSPYCGTSQPAPIPLAHPGWTRPSSQSRPVPSHPPPPLPPPTAQSGAVVMPRVGPLAEVSALTGPRRPPALRIHNGAQRLVLVLHLWPPVGVPSGHVVLTGDREPREQGQLSRSRPLVWGPGLGWKLSWK